MSGGLAEEEKKFNLLGLSTWFDLYGNWYVKFGSTYIARFDLEFIIHNMVLENIFSEL